MHPSACASLRKSFIFPLLRVSEVLADYSRLTECEEALKSIGLLGTSEEIIILLQVSVQRLKLKAWTIS